MFPKKRNYRKRASKTRKSAVGRRGSAVSAGVKKYVKNQIHKNIENKSQTVNFSEDFGNFLQSTTMHAYPMTPYSGYMSIGAGVLQNNRIGNQIRTVKVMLNYVLRPNPYSALSNAGPAPVEVEMFLGHLKQFPSTLPTLTDFNNFYQVGNTSVAPTGNLNDLAQTVNKDYFVIKKNWRHKIGYANNAGTGANVAYQTFANNDFKLNIVKKLNITKMCPQLVQFNDSSPTATSRGLFLWYQGVSSAGNILANTQTPVHIDFWLEYVYEDA